MNALVQPTGSRIFRWRVLYLGIEGMSTETLHMTQLGARFSRWLWR